MCRGQGGKRKYDQSEEGSGPDNSLGKDDNKAKDAASAEGDSNQQTQDEQVEGGSKMQGEGGAEV